jgi:CDP-glycerol glycerophosphotransferase (TagB/SpsB family)
MPTFRDVKSELKPFTTNGLIELNEILKETNSVFLIKKHCAEKNWESLEGYANIWDISEINDAWEILPFTTVVITDYSSVVCDTSLIEKPMIFYHYDYKEYITKQREMAFDYFKDLPGPFVEREEDLISLIKNLDWTKSESYKEKVRQFKQETNLFLDNHSSERVYNEILKEFVA